MIFQEKQSLKANNTFGLDCQAQFFATFTSEEELKTLLPQAQKPLLVLGGGNIAYPRF